MRLRLLHPRAQVRGVAMVVVLLLRLGREREEVMVVAVSLLVVEGKVG